MVLPAISGALNDGAGSPAFADSVGSHGALALAALVAAHSPLVGAFNKTVMAKMLNGNLAFAFPAGHTISVQADSVVCRASNVDISAHSCQLKFGAVTRNLTGRYAHELYATIGEAGNDEQRAEFKRSAHDFRTRDWRYLATPESQRVEIIKADVPGLALPREVIDKVYYSNAVRAFALTAQ